VKTDEIPETELLQ